MRQRIISVVTWIALTILATGVGFVAISTVGDVLRGSGPLGTPLGTDFSIAQHRHDVSPEAAPPLQSTYRHQLATLTVRCLGHTARVLDWQPTPGATVVSTDLGPDEDIHFDLDTNGVVVRLEVYCNRGEPRLVIEPRS
ncbi:MAG: hypothetical protein M3257_02545 [Actinomycetota bacterium]|nr:hypothetical protein [Actinomycetota bacterium]